MGALARRLNTEIPGFRSLVAKTARAMPLADDQGKALTLTPDQTRAKLLELDERWGDTTYWQAIAKNGSRTSPFYLLAALDHRQDAFGHIEATDPDEQIYVAVFGRTFVISAMVTLFALLLGYPLSYWIASLPERRANLVMVMVLIPFWTSILVRVAAWIVLLQTEGLIPCFIPCRGRYRGWIAAPSIAPHPVKTSTRQAQNATHEAFLPAHGPQSPDRRPKSPEYRALNAVPSELLARRPEV